MPRSRRRKRVPPNPHERMQLDARPSDSRTIAVQKQALVYSTCLDTEIVRADGGTVSEARRVSPEHTKYHNPSYCGGHKCSDECNCNSVSSQTQARSARSIALPCIPPQGSHPHSGHGIREKHGFASRLASSSEVYNAGYTSSQSDWQRTVWIHSRNWWYTLLCESALNFLMKCNKAALPIW